MIPENDTNSSTQIEIVEKNCLKNVVLLKAVNDHRKCNILHDRFDILFLLGGGNEMTYRKTKIQGKAGTIEVFEPGEVHTTEKIYSPGNYYVASISATDIANYAQENFGFKCLPHFLIQNTPTDLLFTKYKSFLNVYESDSSSLEIQSKYLIFLNTLFQYSCEDQIGHTHFPDNMHLLLRAKDYLHSHFMGDITLDELAHVACLSKFHFIRSFKSHFGMSPHQYQIQLRINYFKNEFEKGNGFMIPCCFSDQSHFIKYFKKNIGVTPTQYAKTFAK